MRTRQFIVIACIALGLSGCEKSPVGKWQDITDPNTIEFLKDGSFVATDHGHNLVGKWTMGSDGKVVIEFSMAGSTSAGFAHFDGDELVLEGPHGGPMRRAETFSTAWSATEDFEYPVGTNLNGQTGGSGWDGAWAETSGLKTVSSPIFSGSSAIQGNTKATAAGSWDTTRALSTNVMTGIFRVYVYVSSNISGSQGWAIVLKEGSTNRFKLVQGDGATASGMAVALEGASNAVLGTTAPGVWNYYDIQLDQANSRARASVNGGPWSAYVTASDGTFGSINAVRITSLDGSPGDLFVTFDKISVGTGP